MTDEVWQEIRESIDDIIREVVNNQTLIQTTEEYYLRLKDWKVDLELHLDSCVEALRDHPNKKLVKFFIKREAKLLRWTNSLLRTDVQRSKHFRLLKKLIASMLFITFILKVLLKEEV